VANEVYANGMELACKAGQGKSICAFPDVCMTPPENPATPPGVPIPYPNTGMASDTTDGSKSVQISGQEVMLKNKSYFKKSTGDEAGSAAKKGVITSVNTGKVYFNAWSMDVKFEGENVVRNLDLTTHNHASVPGNTLVWPFLDQQYMSTSDPCFKDVLKVQFSCSGEKEKDCPDPKSGYKENECVKAKRCMLQPYNKTEKDAGGCCNEQTGHHLIPKRGFKEFEPGYNPEKAPCVCAEGTSWHREGKEKTPDLPPGELTHADMHAGQDYLERKAQSNPTEGGSKSKPHTYAEARENAVATHAAVFSEAGCNGDCIRKQLDNYHKQESVGVKDNDLLTSPPSGWPGIERIESDPLNQQIIDKTNNVLNNIKQQAMASANQANSLVG
jgi:hypothetical protein